MSLGFRADLHCHTSCSDGSMTPVEVVALAKKIGLSGLAITDHDTIEAYKTAIPEAQQVGLLLGTGVEFSCDFESATVHVLAYDFLLDSPAIRHLCDRHRTRREERNRKMLDKLKRIGKPIDENALGSSQTIGRPHIAQAMIKKGYVKSLKEAFDIYLGEGKCCYDAGEAFSVAETIEIIHAAGGKAFIAHPHLIENRQCVRKILDLPFDGLECYYSRCSPEKERRWVKMAKAKKWLISGGSDFHGDLKMHIPLGCSWVDEPTFRSIFSRLC
jgi:predicted metal-dependent phosphoesterase TrpH